MKTYKARLKAKRFAASNVVSFEFEKPAGFEFMPGQYAIITKGSGTKPFSIASAPYEGVLLFAMRRGVSDFKKSFNKMNTGEKAEISEAMGKFILHKDQTIPAVFLVGGIGITPVRSILRESAYQNLKHKFYLFYSNKEAEDTPFLQEMQNIQNLELKFIPIFTNRQGHINSAMVKKYIKDAGLPIYYIVGPPDFVQTMLKVLKNLGIDKSKIKLETFGGY